MAKRGETRPWRVRFEWANGIKGTITTDAVEYADDHAAKLCRNADNNGSSILIRIEHRQYGLIRTIEHDGAAAS